MTKRMEIYTKHKKHKLTINAVSIDAYAHSDLAFLAVSWRWCASEGVHEGCVMTAKSADHDSSFVHELLHKVLAELTQLREEVTQLRKMPTASCRSSGSSPLAHADSGPDSNDGTSAKRTSAK